MTLSNKTILISGANRGIGAAILREMLKSDVATIYAGARDPASLPDFGDSRVVPLALDIRDDASVLAASRAAPQIDVLINNAGTMQFGDWLSTSPEALEIDMDTNFYGTLRMINAFAPAMVARGSGVIANMVSIVGLAPVPLLSAYSASKAALQSLTQSLRGTLEPSGVKVIGIYPGPVDTDLAQAIPLDKVSPQEAAANIVAGIAEGTPSIFPDPMARQVEHLFATDARQLEAAMRVGG